LYKIKFPNCEAGDEIIWKIYEISSSKIVQKVQFKEKESKDKEDLYSGKNKEGKVTIKKNGKVTFVLDNHKGTW